MPRPRRTKEFQTFHVEAGDLVRTVDQPNGPRYEQRCTFPHFQDVIWAIANREADGVTTGELWQTLPEVPATQASVVLAFLKERGCVDVCRRRCFAASDEPVEDALTEYWALREGAPLEKPNPAKWEPLVSDPQVCAACSGKVGKNISWAALPLREFP